MYLPVAGKVTAVNTKLTNDPGVVNSSPEKDGWFVQFKASSPKDVASLMDEQQYKAHVAAQKKH